MRSTIIIILLFFLYANPVLGQEKLSQRLKVNRLRTDQRKHSFSISVKNDAVFMSQYKELKILQQHTSSKTFVIENTLQWVLDNLLRDDNIVFIDMPLTARTESVNESANPSVNRINMILQNFPSVNGEGHHISIKEQQFDPNDTDLIGRSFTTSVSPPGISHHATAMATFIGGAGNSSEKGRGVAPRAELTSSDFTNLLPDNESVFLDNDIVLQNHSYGTTIENYYGNEAAAYDQQTFAIPELLHVFSAGNIGTTAPTDGKYKGFNAANLSGNFKQAKNALVVSAMNESLRVPDINSRGPAFDGRVKPELVAYGAGGTSDAAAIVSGISALVQQYYVERTGSMPPSAAVKAVLIATADDVEAKGIDQVSGYGNVNAFNALRLIDQGLVKVVSLHSHETITMPIDVPPGMSELRIAVVWTDPPASPNAANVLVHDINSHLTIGSTICHPWKLKTAANLDSLAAPAYRGIDVLNNVEYITVDNPSAGIQELSIAAPQLTTETQSVSVAYWFEAKDFSWNYPVATDVVEGGITIPILWSNTNGTGSLWHKLNDGEWILDDNNVSLDQPYWWSVPETLAEVQLKMEINNVAYVSDQFLISPRPRMRVLYNCTDEFALSWRAISGAEGYKVFTLDQSFVSGEAAVEDTVLVRSEGSAKYFSVAPMVGSRSGLRNIAMDYAAQGTGCFINLFSAQRLDVDQVILQLQLSTLLNVDEVIFYRLQGSSREVVFSAKPDQLNMISYDKDLIEADTIYFQAEVVLTNGIHISSEAVAIYIPERYAALVYPNPLLPGIDLTVVSDGTGQLFRVVDGTGKSVYETTLDFMEESIRLDQLVPGFYFFQLISEGRMIDTGKFMKL
jgi:hypothetical protein